MSERFKYLIPKIIGSDFCYKPFKHLEIQEFLKKEDFEEIISSKEVSLSEQSSDTELFEELFDVGYKIIPFPGAVTDHKLYISRRKKGKVIPSHSSCESAGVVLRLLRPNSQILIDLKNFIESKEFNMALAEKFNLKFDQCSIDTGIQKYLDEYEISPHPDLRKKALTYMININPSDKAKYENHHTHYLEFKTEKIYVKEYWKGNPLTERCWVPWDWCKTNKEQKENNSIVIFNPSYDTLHGVKANYSHLKYQRTQIYGNLWYINDKDYNYVNSNRRLDWWDFDFTKEPNSKKSYARRIYNKIKSFTKSKSKSDFIDQSRKGNY